VKSHLNHPSPPHPLDTHQGRDIDGAATNSRGGGHGVAHAIQSRDCVAGTANFAGVLSTASEITSGSGRGCRDGAGAGDSGGGVGGGGEGASEGDKTGGGGVGVPMAQVPSRNGYGEVVADSSIPKFETTTHTRTHAHTHTRTRARI